MMNSFTNMGLACFLLIISTLYGLTASVSDLPKSAKSKPHIIFILVDDLGFNDVGYNGELQGSAVRTPNIDRIARKGVILNNYYVQQSCSPTRASLMTGRYTIHTGLQHSTIAPTRPHCLPLDEVTLAQKLKESGYSTHMLGKWHLGFYKKECLPTYRGFDTFLGFYLGSQDHYQHTRPFKKMPEAYDFHKDSGKHLHVARQYTGKYSTHIVTQKAQKIMKHHNQSTPLFLFLSFQAPHGPLQAPNRYKKQFVGIIKDKSRLLLAAMIACLDEAIGTIFRTLKTTGLYKNSVVIFSTDNGGVGVGNNWPLRGSKGTLWEGALRGVSFVTSPYLPKDVRGTTSNALFHVTDWFPTIVKSLAGGKFNGTKPLDGVNIWNALRSGGPSPRSELLHNIDPLYDKRLAQDKKYHFDTSIQAAFRYGDWKLLTGNPGDDTGWTAPPESNFTSIKSSDPDPSQKHLWLFNITADPLETTDISENNPRIVKFMLRRLKYHYKTMVPPLYPNSDRNVNPAYLGGVWIPWWDKLYNTFEVNFPQVH